MATFISIWGGFYAFWEQHNVNVETLDEISESRLARSEEAIA